MKSIDELKAKQARELAELEAAHAIAEAMPLKPASVQPWAATGEPWINYKARGIRGALALLRQFAVVPFAEYRNGTLSLKPLEQCPPEFAADNCASFACALDVNQSVGSFGPNARLYFFARVAPVGLARINIDIEGPDYIGAFFAVSASYETFQGRLKRSGQIRPNYIAHGLADRTIKWAGGSPENIHYCYLFASDQFDIDQPGDELSHARGQLQNLSDAVDAKESAQ